MIYSILQHKEIPVTVTKKSFHIENFGDMTKYIVHDASEKRIHIGYVDVKDTKNGIEVLYIKNQHPNLYKHFGFIADQIEVEHCMQRGFEKPYIQSVAILSSHIQHFKRGKRFISEGINIYLNSVCQNLQNGENILTTFLGQQPMFMPQNLVQKYKDLIKKSPLIK